MLEAWIHNCNMADTRPNKVSVKFSLTSPITLQALSKSKLSANRQVVFLENDENKAVPQDLSIKAKALD